ncbi:hypothetical protein [Macrococcus armenti]|nr:hypothetical protein [Macrococcus armenti]UBH14841.1 hypothetical protein LAU44_08735 [Macrococcus armenti]UBH17201.1 hypothetical protein LAU39_08765 [Macrococcus armenti]UBH19466.1 hypothetical protein LAU40_08745 [Macrococcus armenti]
MNRNHEKELLFYQQELAKVTNEKIILQAMLDDSLAKIEELQKQEPTA